ncbi:hypothetical protein DSO57_1005941 [Entomophthora muscae]|uniref:Uncharacterized protein n=1 Tax=Entomophthora muscae TaxID=34485 RepID=A0ACC2RYW8_9FUNG|nr:hypothetical protein DSO57_1005941 [Entomophthora muscae]
MELKIAVCSKIRYPTYGEEDSWVRFDGKGLLDIFPPQEFRTGPIASSLLSPQIIMGYASTLIKFQYQRCNKTLPVHLV